MPIYNPEQILTNYVTQNKVAVRRLLVKIKALLLRDDIGEALAIIDKELKGLDKK